MGVLLQVQVWERKQLSEPAFGLPLGSRLDQEPVLPGPLPPEVVVEREALASIPAAVLQSALAGFLA